ncbi:hypothetical protein NW762_011939 [Fusarium torreyae]|uniref:BTB domain-containing protein n=1 Tax=Fusarium torreyae TaxID=1237075 RepID=A0A9W8RNB2_9HYPO|nr:hypothetical protein NW762_011939 [Fusarium torreyae]
MVHYGSDSGPLIIDRGSQKTASSKKTSTYVFDTDGDTHLILNTYKAQPFNWEVETIWLGQKTSSKKRLKKKKKAKKVDRKDLILTPIPPPPPAEIPESPFPFPTTFGELLDAIPAELNRTSDEHPEVLHTEKMESGGTGAEVSGDSSSLQVQDWDYGERSGILPDQVEVRMLVSGKHLKLASMYFKKMFAGPFTEGKADQSGLRRVTASDWDPEAFNIVLTIMHGYHRDVPRSLSLDMLAKVAMIVDYYECHESVELYANIWLENVKAEIPTVYGRDCIICMLISWVFSQRDVFQKMTRLAVRHSGRLIEAENLPIPAMLLEKIDKARQNSLVDIFSAIYDLLDRLQEESECSYECSSMLLGVLTKELRKHGILSPRSAQPFYGFSIEGSKNLIKDMKVPLWYDTNSGRYSSTHSCTIQQKLSLALQKMEKDLRVFDLQDFQLA